MHENTLLRFKYFYITKKIIFNKKIMRIPNNFVKKGLKILKNLEKFGRNPVLFC